MERTSDVRGGTREAAFDVRKTELGHSGESFCGGCEPDEIVIVRRSSFGGAQ